MPALPRKERRSTTDRGRERRRLAGPDQTAAPESRTKGQCSECGTHEGILIVSHGDFRAEYCADCFELRADPAMRPLIRFYRRLARPVSPRAAPPATARLLDVCPRCGLSREDAMLTGMMGCPSCYEAFEADVLRALEMLHSL